MRKHLSERRMDQRVRVAFRQQPAQCTEVGHPIGRMRNVEEGGRREFEPLDRIGAEMLIEPGAPSSGHAIAGLQDRAQAPACSAIDQAEMTSMLAGHQFENGIRLPMAARPEHDPFIAPLHRALIPGEFQSHFAVAFRIVAPAFADFHEQEEVYRLLANFRDLAPRLRANGLDGPTTLSQDYFSLAVALDEDGLFNSNRPVLEFLPLSRFHRRLIWQLLVKAQIELFARDLSRELAQGRVGDLIFRIKPWSG